MKKRILVVLMTMFMFIMVGCSPNSEREVTDREGSKVSIPNKIEKIISTAPSNTEVIVELGLGDKLVATDKYSSDIPGVDKSLTKIDFSNPDAEAIIGLEPDIIIASGHNKTGSSEDPFKLVREAGIPVVYIPSSDSIDGIYKDIQFIASVLNVENKGTEIVDSMKVQIEEIAKIGKTIEDKKSVYFEIAPAPKLFTFGNGTFLNEMITLIGATNVFESETGWISPSAEAIIDANPDLIFTNVIYIENPIEDIKTRVGFENIDAVKNNEVYKIDKNSSSRPSQNIILALTQMAKSIYPEKYGK